MKAGQDGASFPYPGTQTVGILGLPMPSFCFMSEIFRGYEAEDMNL